MDFQHLTAAENSRHIKRLMEEARKRGLSFSDLPGFDWRPLPRQREALETPAFETLYGGAAGGGKSDLLLACARMNHKAAILFRRTYPSLEDSLVVRSKAMYGDDRYYNTSKHVWNLPDGRRIRLSHLEDEMSVLLHRSAQYDFIGFDEVTEFTKIQYEYMLSRARTVLKGQRVRIIACTNPGGIGNDWVMERWAPWLREGDPNPAQPGELRYYKRDEVGDETPTTRDDPLAISRTFIPARLSDNPYLAADGLYQKTLAFLPEPYRSQLLDGSWTTGLLDDAYQVIPSAWIKAAQARWTGDGARLPLTAIGCDVARGGEDKTVICLRHGNWFAPLRKYAGLVTPDGSSVATLISLALGGEDVAVRIDVIGIGSSAYDVCRQKGIRAVGVNFSEKSGLTDRSGRLKFINKRAESWWKFREALDPDQGDSLALPPDEELAADLKTPKWSVAQAGIKVESKDDIRSRLKRSPDSGDAVVLAYATAAGDTNVLEFIRLKMKKAQEAKE